MENQQSEDLTIRETVEEKTEIEEMVRELVQKNGDRKTDNTASEVVQGQDQWIDKG